MIMLLVIASIGVEPLNTREIFLCEILRSNYTKISYTHLLTFVNSEIPQNKIRESSFSERETGNILKNIGILGVEFIGASIPVWVNELFIWEVWLKITIKEAGKEARWPFALWYIGGNTILAASSVWGIGHIFKQKNSFKKSATGALVGSIIGIGVIAFPVYSKRELNLAEFLIVVLVPQVGAVIGYNWR